MRDPKLCAVGTWGTVAAVLILATAAHADLIVIGDSLAAWPNTWPTTIGARSIAESGTTWHDWTLRTHKIASTAGHDVLILLGTNDALQGRDAEQVREDIVALVAALQQAGATQIALLGSPRSINPNDLQAGVNDRLGQYRSLELDVCREAAIHCGPDLFTRLEPEDYAADGRHLSAQGNATVAAVVPEPTTAILLASGLLALSASRRSHRPQIADPRPSASRLPSTHLPTSCPSQGRCPDPARSIAGMR